MLFTNFIKPGDIFKFSNEENEVVYKVIAYCDQFLFYDINTNSVVYTFDENKYSYLRMIEIIYTIECSKNVEISR